MRRIFISAGHKGPGTGAVSPKSFKPSIDEGAETIWLRDEIVKHLEKKGVKVTVDENKSVLSAVVAKFKKLIGKEDIEIDIHFNSYSSPAANGTETIVPHDANSFEKKMAKEVLDLIVSLLGTKSRGVKSESQSQHTRLAMLSGFDAQQFLIEVCFVSNQNDCKLYHAKREELAKKLADKIYDLAQL